MRVRVILLLALGLATAGCGDKRNDQAAAACGTEIANKLKGKTYEIDPADLAQHVKAESAGTILLSSTAVFDKGLSTEYKQAYDCRVRFDKADVPSVIFLEFYWNKEDIKKANQG